MICVYDSTFNIEWQYAFHKALCFRTRYFVYGIFRSFGIGWFVYFALLVQRVLTCSLHWHENLYLKVEQRFVYFCSDVQIRTQEIYKKKSINCTFHLCGTHILSACTQQPTTMHMNTEHRIEIMKTLLAALLLFDTVVGWNREASRQEMDMLLSVGVSQRWIKQTRDYFNLI